MSNDVSIKDIARILGLSVSTVSRAINGIYGVNQATRGKVLETARELGYVQNAGAKGLVEKKSRLIGIVAPEVESRQLPLFPLSHLSRTVKSFGRDTIVSFVEKSTYMSGDLDKLCRSRNLEGVILLAGFGPRHIVYEDIKKLSVPAVLYSEDMVGRTYSSVGSDDCEGARLAVAHLSQLGHERIGFINGPAHASVCVNRLKGYLLGLKNAGIPTDEQMIIHSDFTGSGGATSTEELVREFPDLTAIFYANDLMAMGGISVLHQMGVSIPEDISVVGYDNIAYAEVLVPPLTTIAHSSQLSLRATELLLSMISGESGRLERLRPELVIRSSAGAPRK